jgi:hypothetical protein
VVRFDFFTREEGWLCKSLIEHRKLYRCFTTFRFGGGKSMSENSKKRNTELGSSVNPQAGSLRYHCSAGILPAGSGGILPPVHYFQTGSKEGTRPHQTAPNRTEKCFSKW